MDRSKRYRYVISAALLAIIVLFAQVVKANSVAERYIGQYKLIAVQEMEKHGIPASITLAQGMLESGYGESLLAKQANNHFGIKCHAGWEGERYYFTDDAENECFRVYNSAYESFIDHSDFLVNRKRYEKLFTFKLTDYKSWAIELKRAGYATNPNYPSLLINLIKKHKLYEYDRITVRDVKDEIRIDEMDPVVKVDGNTHGDAVQYSRWKIIQHNRINTIIVQEGDTYDAIAIETNIKKNKLLKWNDMYPGEDLVTGQYFYLQPKRNKAVQKMHQVKGDETMREISQLYGVRLNKLLEKNLMHTNQQVETGEWVYLRKKRKTPPKLKNKNPDFVPEIVIIEPPKKVEVKKFPDPGVPKIEFYTVAHGDTLYSIAKKHNTTVDKLREINRLHNNNIHPGDEIRVK